MAGSAGDRTEALLSQESRRLSVSLSVKNIKIIVYVRGCMHVCALEHSGAMGRSGKLEENFV